MVWVSLTALYTCAGIQSPSVGRPRSKASNGGEADNDEDDDEDDEDVAADGGDWRYCVAPAPATPVVRNSAAGAVLKSTALGERYWPNPSRTADDALNSRRYRVSARVCARVCAREQGWVDCGREEIKRDRQKN